MSGHNFATDCRKRSSQKSSHDYGRTGQTIVSALLLSVFFLSLFLIALVSGCSMSEELKRIEKTAAVEDKQDASRSSSLTGEQLFIRSCNTCHPAGKAGLGQA